jgi:hypothetical protein
MQDQIRQAIMDLILLSQAMNCSQRTRILETIDRFRSIVEVDDYSLSLYEKLFTEKPPCQQNCQQKFDQASQ